MRAFGPVDSEFDMELKKGPGNLQVANEEFSWYYYNCFSGWRLKDL